MTHADIEFAIAELEAAGLPITKNMIFSRVKGNRGQVLRLADEVLSARAGAGAVPPAPTSPEASAPAAPLYEVLRAFSADEGQLRVGQLVTASTWRNLRGLVAGRHPWLRPYVPRPAAVLPADPPAPVVPDQKAVIAAEADLEAAHAAAVDAKEDLARARADLQAWADDQRFGAGLPPDDPWRSEVEAQRAALDGAYGRALEDWRSVQVQVSQAQARLGEGRRLALEAAQRAWVKQAHPELFAELERAQDALGAVHPVQDAGEYQKQKWIIKNCEEQIHAIMSTAVMTPNLDQKGSEHDET